MKINKLLAGILIVFTIVFLAIKTGSKTSSNQAALLANTNNMPTTSTNQSATIGSIAPDFTLTDLDGKQYNLKTMQGKVVVLFGMAGWCGECIPEGQALSQIQQNYGDKVQAIGVAFTQGDNKTLLNEYKQTGKVTIPLAVDTNNVGKKYNLTQLDTTYIINKQGLVVYKSEQAMTYGQIKEQLDKII